MQPWVVKREGKVHLTYDFERHIHCSALLATPAPNGSTILLVGHDTGLQVLWRGGRKLKQQVVAQTDPDIIELDEDDEVERPSVEYETEGEELDIDAPYPEILCDLEIDLDHAVTKMAVVQDQPQKSRSSIADAVVAIATGDGGVQLLRIPLHVLKPGAETDVAASIAHKALKLKESSSYVRGLAAKIVSGSDDKFTIVVGSDILETWQISQLDSWKDENLQYSSTAYHGMLSRLSFHPSPRVAEFIAVNKFGTVDAYELLTNTQDDGAMTTRRLYTLMTPFESSESTQPGRKRILDACFVRNGKSVLALLNDAQWGVWSTVGTREARGIEHFHFSGYLDSATAASSGRPDKKTVSSLLNPMTPNTRKTKSEDFFSTAQSRSNSTLLAGGVAVSRASTSVSSTDESVMIWHQSNLYSIPSFESFHKRSTEGSGGLGSLHAPGIASILGVNVFNEMITSLSQFRQPSSTAGLGVLKTQRDFMLSTEHRLIMVQNQTPSSFTNGLVKQAEVRDQRMLAAGALDIGGMDRMLASMSNGRQVNFAQ